MQNKTIIALGCVAVLVVLFVFGKFHAPAIVHHVPPVDVVLIVPAPVIAPKVEVVPLPPTRPARPAVRQHKAPAKVVHHKAAPPPAPAPACNTWHCPPIKYF